MSPSTLPINRDVSAVLIDNDPLMAGIDVPDCRTINLIGPVSQAGNHGHRQTHGARSRSRRGSWHDQQRRSASAGAGA